MSFVPRAGSVSREKSSRSFSSFSSHGQPKLALSQAELTKELETGFSTSADTQDVSMAFQPPAFGGSFLTRRATTVCQSLDCMSTLKPAFSISDFATGPRLVRTCRSVECSRTTGVPS